MPTSTTHDMLLHVRSLKPRIPTMPDTIDQAYQALCLLPSCGKTFRKLKPWQKFCSRQCRDRYWNLQNPRIKTFLKDLNHSMRAQLTSTLKESKGQD